MRFRLLPIALSLALAAGCASNPDVTAEKATPASQSPPATSVGSTVNPAKAPQFDGMLAEYWEESLKLNPVQATFVGDTRYNDQLPNFLSAEFRQKVHDFTQQWLDRAKSIDPEMLDAQDRLSYEIFVREQVLGLESEKYPGWMIPLNQFGSIASFIPMLGSGTSAQPFETVKDYDNWLSRGHAVPAIFDTAISNMREGIKAGVVQPKVLMERVLPQLDAMIPGKSEDGQIENSQLEKNMFWQPITRLPKEFKEVDRARLTAAYRSMIAEQLVPAYRRLRDFVANEYLTACRETAGLAALPNGEAWYAFNVKTQTTTDKTPSEIHQLGLNEVTRIHGEMRGVMQQVGFKGELSGFFEFMNTHKQFEFKDEAQLLAHYNALRARIDARIPEHFSLLPKAPFEIRPVEAFRAKSAAGGQYFPPSEDGSRPGVFYVNTFDLPTRRSWDSESLYLHEAVPGHHFQIALQQELQDVPAFRRFGGETAFAEGWGLYSESLGKDLGVYTDPYQYFGRLQAELWRAIRLVVDTGLHSRGWTREQVIAYMRENSATSQTEAQSEAERYIAIPGQALAYKIGELKILELRARAERALGAGFDPRSFHAEVLRDGAVPLAVLEAKIDRWITGQKSGSKGGRVGGG